MPLVFKEQETYASLSNSYVLTEFNKREAYFSVRTQSLWLLTSTDFELSPFDALHQDLSNEACFLQCFDSLTCH